MGNKSNASPIVKERVKQLLREHEKTQREMSAALDITPEHLARCLTKGSISKSWLKSIAEYLDTSEEYLSGESDDEFLHVWAIQRSQMDGDTLLRQYVHYLGHPPEEQEILTANDWKLMRHDIKNDVDYRFQQRHVANAQKDTKKGEKKNGKDK